MRKRGLGRWAAWVGALVTLGVGYAWCALVLGHSHRSAAAAGLGGAILVFLALRLALWRSRSGVCSRGRMLGVVVVAGCLMLLAGLLELLLPGIERGGLIGTVALLSAAVYFGAALFEVMRGRGEWWRRRD